MATKLVNKKLERNAVYNPALDKFATILEQVCIETVESGKMTKDLALIVKGSNKVEHGKDYLYTEEFLDAIDAGLKSKLSLAN